MTDAERRELIELGRDCGTSICPACLVAQDMAERLRHEERLADVAALDATVIPADDRPT